MYNNLISYSVQCKGGLLTQIYMVKLDTKQC